MNLQEIVYPGVITRMTTLFCDHVQKEIQTCGRMPYLAWNKRIWIITLFW